MQILQEQISVHVGNAGAIADDCTDAGGRATQGAVAEEQISVHAVEKKVTKEKATRLPLISCAPRFRRGLPEGPSLAL